MSEETGLQRWVPLESNPEVLTRYIHELGVAPTAEFVDVLGLDDDLLALVPTPVHALLLLYPITDASEDARVAEDAALAASAADPAAKDVFWTVQKIENACGTIGCVHCVCNSAALRGTLAPGSFFARLLAGAAALSTGDARADALERAEGLESAHDAAAAEGQTDAPDADDAVNLHFVAFAEVGGTLWELDGRRRGPVPRGRSSQASLLHDAAAAVRAAIARDPDEDRFTVLALVGDV